MAKRSLAKQTPAVSDTRPFLGPVLLKSNASKTDVELANSICVEILDRLNLASTVNRKLLSSTNSTEGGLSLATLMIECTTTPAWAPNSKLVDCSHHIIVVAAKGAMAAICASEAAMRDRVSTNLKCACALPHKVIEDAFVGTAATAMWLRGAHVPTASKPTAKSLIGPALEDALDPLGDQSYFYSAVRSTVTMSQTDRLLRKKPQTESPVGAAPSSSRIWLNRPSSWLSFCSDLEAILDRALSPPAPARPPFKALAQRLEGLDGIEDAYDAAMVPFALLSDSDEEERDLAQIWAYDCRFEVMPTIGASLDLDIWVEGIFIGRAKLTISYIEKIKIEIKWPSPPAEGESRRVEFEKAVSKDWLKIYYKDGVTLVGTDAYKMAWRDQPFEWDFHDLTGYEVGEEKPARYNEKTLAECIGTAKEDGTLDNSLFGYVVRKAFTTGWLASDDGSMELADFIHIDPKAQMVSLIHAKASKSNEDHRHVSVAQYEVVVGQAIKNLRHLDRTLLSDALETGKGKKIAGAVWHEGKPQPDRSGMIKAARDLGENYQKRVIIFQPQLTRREWNDCWGPKKTAKGDRLIRMKQLDTLMHAARLSARSTGGDLIGWADASI